jgi:hypothetical protein
VGGERGCQSTIGPDEPPHCVYEWKGAMEQPGLSKWPFVSHLRRRPRKFDAQDSAPCQLPAVRVRVLVRADPVCPLSLEI